MRRPCLLATVVLAGCMSWQSPKNLQEQLRAPAASGTRVRVTTGTGTWTMDSVVITGSALTGLRTDSGAPQPATLPLSDVQRIEKRRVSAGRTVGLIGGIAGFLFAAAGVAVGLSMQ